VTYALKQQQRAADDNATALHSLALPYAACAAPRLLVARMTLAVTCGTRFYLAFIAAPLRRATLQNDAGTAALAAVTACLTPVAADYAVRCDVATACHLPRRYKPRRSDNRRLPSFSPRLSPHSDNIIKQTTATMTTYRVQHIGVAEQT